MCADRFDNELTPRELGLLAGHTWGLASKTTPEQVAEVADPAIGMMHLEVLDRAFRAEIASRMAEFPDAVEAEAAFWTAFVRGFELSSSRTWRESSIGAEPAAALVGAPIRR